MFLYVRLEIKDYGSINKHNIESKAYFIIFVWHA